MNTQKNFFRIPGPFPLDSGAALSEIEIAYHSYGTKNEAGTNTVLVLHALTGSSAAHEWWSGLIGSGALLDPERYFIVAPNLLGSCYGTTGPESLNPRTGRPYLASFPEITPRDMARVVLRLLDALHIETVHLAIGGSLGGMVVLELALLAGERFERIAPIAVSAAHSAWRLAFSSTVRKTILAFDPSLQNREQLVRGMKLARQIAMATYRSAEEFDARFARRRNGPLFEVESYLEHQGEKIAARFSPYSYLTMTRAMELYDLAQGQSVERAARSLHGRALFVGISSDLLYPPQEIEHVASLVPNAEYRTLEAVHGHDSFLVDTGALATLLRPFLESRTNTPSRPVRIHPILSEHNISEEAVAA